MTTHLTRWTPSDDMPLIVLDEAHELSAAGNTAKLIADLCRQGRKAGVNIDLGGDDVWQALRRQAALVETPTGPDTPPTLPPEPTTGQKVDTAAVLTLLAGSITGLALNSSPDLVGYPIAATLLATVIGAKVLYGSPRQVTA
jgi:hypothetical protein